MNIYLLFISAYFSDYPWLLPQTTHLQWPKRKRNFGYWCKLTASYYDYLYCDADWYLSSLNPAREERSEIDVAGGFYVLFGSGTTIFL